MNCGISYAGYLAMLPIRKNSAAVNQRFIEYVLVDGATGRIIDLLRRAAVDAPEHKSKSVEIDQLLIAGATPSSMHSTPQIRHSNSRFAYLGSRLEILDRCSS